MSEPKKILGPIEWGALLLGLGLLAYLTLQKAGYKMVERSEETTFIDPSTSNPLSPSTQKRPSNSEKEVKKMLAEMAATFNNPKGNATVGNAQSSLQKRWNLDGSEARFYYKIKEEKGLKDQFQSAADWFQFLNTSRKTYLRVKNLFAELSPNQQSDTDARAILGNEAAASDFYQKMEDWYDLSAEEIQAFSQEGNNSLEDWAAYLVQRSHSR